jgi:hypothetical protein
MNKIYIFTNETGTFVCFNEFNDETSFEEFISFIEQKLGIVLGETILGPYSVIRKSNYKGNDLTVIYQDDTGCCIRLDKEKDFLVKEIVEKCYC